VFVYVYVCMCVCVCVCVCVRVCIPHTLYASLAQNTPVPRTHAQMLFAIYVVLYVIYIYVSVYACVYLPTYILYMYIIYIIVSNVDVWMDRQIHSLVDV
jgi:hypothetical protein